MCKCNWISEWGRPCISFLLAEVFSFGGSGSNLLAEEALEKASFQWRKVPCRLDFQDPTHCSDVCFPCEFLPGRLGENKKCCDVRRFYSMMQRGRTWTCYFRSYSLNAGRWTCCVFHGLDVNSDLIEVYSCKLFLWAKCGRTGEDGRSLSSSMAWAAWFSELCITKFKFNPWL